MEDVSNSVWFRMVLTLISVFPAKRVTQFLVKNGFYFNFSIFSETCDTVFGLE